MNRKKREETFQRLQEAHQKREGELRKAEEKNQQSTC